MAADSLKGYLLHKTPKQIQAVTVMGKRKCTKSREIAISPREADRLQKTLTSTISTIPNNNILEAYICLRE